MRIVKCNAQGCLITKKMPALLPCRSLCDCEAPKVSIADLNSLLVIVEVHRTRLRLAAKQYISSGSHRVLCISPSLPYPRQSLLTTVPAPARIPPPRPAVSLAAPVLHRPSTCEQSRQLRCARWRCRSPYSARTRWFEEKWKRGAEPSQNQSRSRRPSHNRGSKSAKRCICCGANARSFKAAGRFVPNAWSFGAGSNRSLPRGNG